MRWNVFKWIVGTLVTLGVLGGIFWVVFYSVYFANLSFIITARDWYQSTIWKAEGIILPKSTAFPPFDPVYTIQAQPSTLTGTNTYELLGKYYDRNLDLGLIYIKGYDNKIYPIKISLAFAQNFLLGFTTSDYIPDGNIINYDGSPFTISSSIQIVWDDKRSLQQVLSDYSKNPQVPLNANSTKFFSFSKFN